MNSKTYSMLAKEYAHRALATSGSIFSKRIALKCKVRALIEHDRLMDIHYEAAKTEKAFQV